MGKESDLVPGEPPPARGFGCSGDPLRGEHARAQGQASALVAISGASGPAWARGHACERPARPDIPAGYAVDGDEMRDVEAGYDGHAASMEAYLECLDSEREDAATEWEYAA